MTSRVFDMFNGPKLRDPRLAANTLRKCRTGIGYAFDRRAKTLR
jgi:hypothetical protein